MLNRERVRKEKEFWRRGGAQVQEAAAIYYLHIYLTGGAGT